MTLSSTRQLRVLNVLAGLCAGAAVVLIARYALIAAGALP